MYIFFPIFYLQFSGPLWKPLYVMRASCLNIITININININIIIIIIILLLLLSLSLLLLLLLLLLVFAVYNV